MYDWLPCDQEVIVFSAIVFDLGAMQSGLGTVNHLKNCAGIVVIVLDHVAFLDCITAISSL